MVVVVGSGVAALGFGVLGAYLGWGMAFAPPGAFVGSLAMWPIAKRIIAPYRKSQ
jgi:hypothetical protein